MKLSHRSPRRLLACGIALAVLPGAGVAQTPGPVARFRAMLDSVVADGTTPGASLHVNLPSLGIYWSGAAGVVDMESARRLTPDHPVRIASNTKTYVAAAILRLWEEGRLGLDDPAARHLPLDHLEMMRADGYDPAAMTVRHLLTHTSGLYDYADRDLFVRAILDDPLHRWTREEQLAKAMEWGDPYGPPGEVYRYSDTGYILLGAILERVTGLSLAEALRSLLDYGSLGLRSTWLETLEPAPTGALDRAHQYLGERDTYAWDPSFDLYGGGGLVSTPTEMAAFMRALFTGEVYASRYTAETMLTTVEAARGGPDLSGSPQVPGVYRMGVFARDVGGLPAYLHTGFWGTLAAYFPDTDLSIGIAVTRQGSPALFRLFIGVLEVLNDVAAAGQS